MKFADGFWLNQRGYEVNYAVQAYDVVEVENGFMVVATPFFGRERYKLLGSANLEITYTSEFENVIGEVFSKLSRDDEEKLTNAMTVINNVLKDMEVA